MLRNYRRFIARAGFVGLFAGCAHPSHHAGPPGGLGELSGISVVGRGEARAAPDIARATVGLEIRADSAEQATTQANERMAAVIAALKAAGVAESDLRTNNFSVSFERDYVPEPPPMPVSEPAPAQPKPNTRAAAAPVTPTPPPAPRGNYRASNTVEVVIRNIASVGQVLAAANQAGANNVWGIQFELADYEPLRARARELAVANARQSAAQLAQLSGVRLGRIRSVADGAGAGPGPMFAGEMRAQMADASSVPVQRGELTVVHEVRVTYSLDDP